MRTQQKNQRRKNRRAAVAVEFAMVAPMLLAIILGLVELTRAYDAQNLLETAAREGARFAAMDQTDMLQEGETPNSKLVQDVTNFLTSAGMPAGSIQVNVLDAANPSLPFDLSDPANDLRLFQVEISVPFSAISYTPITEAYDYTLVGSIVFRNGRATLSQ